MHRHVSGRLTDRPIDRLLDQVWFINKQSSSVLFVDMECSYVNATNVLNVGFMNANVPVTYSVYVETSVLLILQVTVATINMK